MHVMSEEAGLKSAYELAMERLRNQDTEAGVKRQVVTEAQKAAVAEVRSVYEAKLAQLEVLHRGQVVATMDPSERAALDETYRRERDRLIGEREARVEKARSSGAT